MSSAGRGVGAIAPLCLLMTVVVAGPASAANYNVIECTANYGGIGAPDANGFASNLGPTLTDGCTASLNYAGLTAQGQDAGAPHQGGATNGWRYASPPETQFVSAFALAHGNSQAGVFPEIVSVNSGNAFQWAGTGSAMDGSPDWLGWNGEGGAAQAIEFRVRCAFGGGCNASGSAYVTVQQFGFTLSDSEGPSLGEIGGALLDTSRSARGTVGVEIGGSDVGSGLYVAYVDAGSRRIAEGGYPCEVTSDGQGRRLVPCLGSSRRTVDVNTSNPVLYPGINRVRLCVADLAGQAACQDADARIDNACPDAGVAVAKLRRVRFKGGGAGKRPTERTRFGRRVKLRGRAIDLGGNPVADATICLGHHIAGDRYGAEEVNWTRTGRSGRFRFKLQRGPSKDYRIAAWQAAVALEEFRTLLVKAKPKLKIKGQAQPGARIRLRVKLNPPLIAGKIVRMQAKSNAGWVGVPRCSGQTDAEGRFGCRARIPHGTAGAELMYRAVVPREESYPYLRGHSRVKSTRVRG